MKWLGDIAGEDDSGFRVDVLFGGVLGSLYSLLQFVFSPIWGRLSDRVGRRPVLLLTVTGMSLSYLVWIFAGSFELFLAARILGGIMAGNISTATAAMADITSRAERAKGMGIIGAAFGLGFILGPALGGLLSRVSLTGIPGVGAFLHPFSAAAVAACGLSALNLIWVIRRFRETLPPEARGQSTDRPDRNPVALFRNRFGSPIARTNLAYFIFLVAFSGMEFTLTFLVRDRLEWDPLLIGLMFVYVGVIIALVQGGIVRRLAPRLGEKRVAMTGLTVIVPGLVGLAFAGSGAGLYAWLAPMAIGSALAIPTLTSMVSLLAPPDRQGAALGVFRSLGALARVVGPLLACVAYWKLGPGVPYLAGAGILVVPLLLVSRVPQPNRE